MRLFPKWNQNVLKLKNNYFNFTMDEWFCFINIEALLFWQIYEEWVSGLVSRFVHDYKYRVYTWDMIVRDKKVMEINLRKLNGNYFLSLKLKAFQWDPLLISKSSVCFLDWGIDLQNSLILLQPPSKLMSLTLQKPFEEIVTKISSWYMKVVCLWKQNELSEQKLIKANIQ